MCGYLIIKYILKLNFINEEINDSDLNSSQKNIINRDDSKLESNDLDSYVLIIDEYDKLK